MSSVDFDSKIIEIELKKEVSSQEGELKEEFIPEIRHLVPDIEIKHEKVDFRHNATSHFDYEDHFDMDIGAEPSIPHVDYCSVNVTAEEKNLNAFYFDLLQCQEDCDTCQRYLRILSEHVTSTHAPSQSTRDPLHTEHTEHGRARQDKRQRKMSGSRKSTMSSEDFNSDVNELTVKEETNSNEDELAEEFMTHIQTTQSSSICHLVPDLEIKQQEVDFHNNTSKPSSDPETYCDQEFDTASSTSHVLHCSTVKHENKDLNDFYLDLLQCQRDCETCQKYLKMLSEHIRSTHCLFQPTQDLLHIDPFNVDTDPPPCSSIQIKCEGDNNIDEVECSKQEDLKFEFEPETEGERDTDCTPSSHLTPNIIRRRLTKDKFCADSKSSKPKNQTPPSQRQFKCNECDKSLSTKSNLFAHMRIHSGERPHKCDVCQKSFLSSSHLTTHKRIHTGEKPYRCEECELRFSDKSALSSHKITHTGEKPLKCDVCEKKFRNLSCLNIHKRTHTGERPFECTVCKKGFTSFSRLNAHKVIHTGEMAFQCEQCEKRFTRSDQLKIHRRIHTGEKPHKCDVCEKIFSCLANMTRHKRTHIGEKPHKCEECEMSFSEKSALSSHKSIHTGEMPFKCDVCEKHFTNLTSLTLHKRTHTGEKLHKCDVCGQRLSRPGDFNRHKRIHTGERPYKCEVCGNSFTRARTLSSHKRIHTGEKLFQCTVCVKSFTVKSTLNEHMRTHTGEKRYGCTLCEKRFTSLSSLTYHARTHTGEKRYGCTLCEKRFTSSSSLTYHARTHSTKTSQM